jgi:hypothetical protein
VTLTIANLIDASAAIPVAVTPDVHPMSSPALAIFRLREKSVDDCFIGTFGVIVQESMELGLRRRNPDQVKIDSAKPHLAWYFRRWL